MNKKDLAKAKKLLGSKLPRLGEESSVANCRYWITAFESNCVDGKEHHLSVTFVGGKTECFRQLSDVQAWVDAQVLNNPLFEVIARKNFGVETLKVQGLDRLDFVEVHILDIQKALRDAFKAGVDSVRRSK